MYEMEGPCPASPRQAGQLPGLAGAARRPPTPGTYAGGRSPRFLPRSRGRPQVVPVSNGEVFLLPPLAWAQGPVVNHFGFFRDPRGIHRTRAVIRIWRRLSTVHSQLVHRSPVQLGEYRDRRLRM